MARQYEVYEGHDRVLPILKLADECYIRVEIDDDRVRLVVGQRDWEWNRKTGQLDNAGTFMSENDDAD